MTQPLIVTRDPELLDALMPLAAAAGVDPVVTADLTVALAHWPRATVVLVGPDLTEVLVRCRLPRREEVYVVTHRQPSGDVFRRALDLGACGVLETAASASWLTERLGAEADGAPGVLVGVVGGSGGAGASTLAAGLARVAAYDAPSLLVDADPHGPGLDRLLGMEEESGVRWTELERTTGRLGGAALREAVPRRDGVGVVTWYSGPQGTLQAFAAREVVAAAVRGHGVSVLDLPRTGGDLVEELAARCDRLVLVVRPSLTGVASAARVAGRFGSERIQVVVRGSGVDVSAIADAVGSPVRWEMPEQRGLTENVDLGLGPLRGRRGPLFRTCRDVLSGLGSEAAAA